MIIIHFLSVIIYCGYTGKSLFFKGAFLRRTEMSRQHITTVDSYFNKINKIFKNTAGTVKKNHQQPFPERGE